MCIICSLYLRYSYLKDDVGVRMRQFGDKFPIGYNM